VFSPFRRAPQAHGIGRFSGSDVSILVSVSALLVKMDGTVSNVTFECPQGV
jgi:hypothetical protein